MRTLTISFALVVSLVACGKKDKEGGSATASSGKVASCNSESLHSCREYRGGNLALGTDSLEKLCTAVSSSFKFAQTACPTANVVGTCKRDEGKDFYYQGYDIEPVTGLEKSCTDRGGTYATK